MRLAWLTDIHLNFLRTDAAWESFGATLSASDADAFCVSGDISVAPRLAEDLAWLSDAADRPVYFVLGNHDAYHGDIETTDETASTTADADERLVYLDGEVVVPLSANAALTGRNGWGDGRAGDPEGSTVRLNDFLVIADLASLSRAELSGALRRLGTAEAEAARPGFEQACDAYDDVYFLTHVPPFPETCIHEGAVSAPDWLPYFTCVAMGEMLRDVLARRPDTTCTVLCGHTHSSGDVTVAPNLRVLVGASEYGAPEIVRAFDIA